MLSSPLSKLLVKPKEAAAMLSISERTLWTLTKLGQVKATPVRRAVRYDVDELKAFIRRAKGEEKE